MTRAELQSALGNLTRDITAQSEAINQRISDALNNVKKEALGTKRANKNAQMLAILPLLLLKGQNLRFKKIEKVKFGDKETDVLTGVEDSGSSNDNNMLLIVMMMMMMGGDKDDDSGNSSMMMMLPLMILLMGNKSSNQSSSLVTTS